MSGRSRRRGRRFTALAVAYWVAVIAVALGLVVALLLLFERRDQGSVSELRPYREMTAVVVRHEPVPAVSTRASFANTTMRRAAL